LLQEERIQAMNTSTKLKRDLCEIAGTLYQRNITDSSGGNISLRHGERVYLTPKGASGIYRWALSERHIVVTDVFCKKIQGDPANITSESSTHFAIYQKLSDIHCVIHCHSPFMMAFGAAYREIPTVINECAKNNLGDLPISCTAEVKPGSLEQSDEVLRLFMERRERHPGSVLIANIPFHGVFIAGGDLSKTFATLEAAECAARVTLYREMLLASRERASGVSGGTHRSASIAKQEE
jgi:L-fuculose-phosphate aldolase